MKSLPSTPQVSAEDIAQKPPIHVADTTFRVSTKRFAGYFPLSHWVVCHVWPLMPCFAVLAILVGQYSVHYGLSVMCVWMGIVCIWVDRKQLDYLLFTPMQPLALMLITSLGLGISLVTIDSTEKYRYGYFVMQMVGLLCVPLFLFGYHLITRNVPGLLIPNLKSGDRCLLNRSLLWVGWFCLLLEFVRALVGVASGVLDRGNASEFIVETPFGWWSFFYVFTRLQYLGYILVALIWRKGRTISRLLLICVVGTLTFLNFLSGGRTATMFPFFVILAGCYMFMEFPRLKYEVLIIGACVVMYPLVTVMAHFRSTEAYRETDIRNVFSKASTLKEGLEDKAATEEDTGEQYRIAGTSFIGVVDYLVYEQTPGTFPHEGFERLDDALWIFLPTMFSKGIERPVVIDSQQIAEPYVGTHLERTAVGLNLTAELYRRWSWLGLPLGLFAYGVLYGLFIRKIHRYFLFRNALWGFMLCGLSLMAWGFGTVLTTLSFWFYDIPKNLLLLAMLYLFLKTFISPKPIPGAVALIESSA